MEKVKNFFQNVDDKLYINGHTWHGAISTTLLFLAGITMIALSFMGIEMPEIESRVGRISISVLVLIVFIDSVLDLIESGRDGRYRS